MEAWGGSAGTRAPFLARERWGVALAGRWLYGKRLRRANRGGLAARPVRAWRVGCRGSPAGAARRRGVRVGRFAEKPQLSTTVIILLAIPETMVILGFVVSILILLRAGPA